MYVYKLKFKDANLFFKVWHVGIVANLWRAGAPARFSGQKFGNKNTIKTAARYLTFQLKIGALSAPKRLATLKSSSKL